MISSHGIERQKKVLTDTKFLNKDCNVFLSYCNCGAINIRTFQDYRRVLSAFPFTRSEVKQIHSEPTRPRQRYV